MIKILDEIDHTENIILLHAQKLLENGNSYYFSIKNIKTPETGGMSGDFKIATIQVLKDNQGNAYIKHDVDVNDNIQGPYVYGKMNPSKTSISFSERTATLETNAIHSAY